MDIADRSAQTEELFLRAALDPHLRPKAPPTMSARDCEDCGEPISVDRLMAVPYAERCVGCEEVQERHQRLHGGRRRD